jgi:threonine/homoserine efflux transporter RhtA
MNCHTIQNISRCVEQIFYKPFDVHAAHPMLWVKLNQIIVYLGECLSNMIFPKLDFVKLVWLKLSSERSDLCFDVFTPKASLT